MAVEYTVFKNTTNEFSGNIKEIADHFNVSINSLRRNYTKMGLEDALITTIKNKRARKEKHDVYNKTYTVFKYTEKEFTGTKREIAEHFNISYHTLIQRITRNPKITMEEAIMFKPQQKLRQKCKYYNKDYIEVINSIMDGATIEEAIKSTSNPYDENKSKEYTRASQQFSYFKQAKNMGLEKISEIQDYNRKVKINKNLSVEKYKEQKIKNKLLKVKKENENAKIKQLLDSLNLENRDFKKYKPYYQKGYSYNQYLEYVFKDYISYNGDMTIIQILDYALESKTITVSVYNILKLLYVDIIPERKLPSMLNLTRQRVNKAKKDGISNINKLFNSPTF